MKQMVEDLKDSANLQENLFPLLQDIISIFQKYHREIFLAGISYAQFLISESDLYWGSSKRILIST